MVEGNRIPKDKAIEILDQEYNSVLEELDSLKPVTPYQEIEDLVLDHFKSCIEFEIEYYFEPLYDYVQEHDYVEEEELYELISSTIHKLDNSCYDNVITNMVDYLYETYGKTKAKRLEREFNKYLDYIITHNL